MNFFNDLQDYSKIKLSILEKYTIPWMRKIILNQFGSKKCLIIDGFAGKGRYDDGEKGSPLILIENSIDFFKQAQENHWKLPQIYIYLNELDKSNFEILKTNVKSMGFEEENSIFTSNKYDTITIIIENKDFESFMGGILSNIKPGRTLIPSFCFVDPFGFSSTPFSIFKEYLKNDNAELLINFIYEFTNRFIRHPNEKVRKQISNHIGLVELDELMDAVKDLSATDRKKMIIETYTNNILKETEAVYVRHFDIKKHGKTKMILFHITKNINGLALMKETMWKHDETGQYVYNQKKELVQLDFIDALLKDKEYHLDILKNLIYSEFKGEVEVGKEIIENYVIEKTDYPLTNFFKPALNKLEATELIYNFSGRKKARFYPKGTIMDFK